MHAFPHRGYMLDVSRGKVPRMEGLLAWIDLLADLGFNHFQLYIEHTFAYRNHRRVWEGASPFTAGEIREIDARCRSRGIEFVPNQNSLGHMEQWLKHPEYAPLAECPEGFQDPWSPDWRTPSTISPVLPGSRELVAGLYAELLPNFTSSLFNVGGDEPFELGKGLSRRRCEEAGKGRVYLEWLLELHALCLSHGRRMMFWADILNEYPELIPELPKDMVPMEWGYEAGHPWDEHCARFAEAGLDFFVCPGTSTWNSISGRTGNMLANLHEAAEAGRRHGALGYLVTEWGDAGHRQFLPTNCLPAVVAATHACGEGFSLPEVLGRMDSRIFSNPESGMARWLHDFGNIYLCDPAPPPNHSRLFMLLHPRDGQGAAEKLTDQALERALTEIGELRVRLACVQIACVDAALIRQEMEVSLGFLEQACRRGIALKQGREREESGRLASDLTHLICYYRKLWLVRNRPGGLEQSLQLPSSLVEHYLKNAR